MTDQPWQKHSTTGLCTLAPKRPYQDTGICRACLEQGLLDEWIKAMFTP